MDPKLQDLANAMAEILRKEADDFIQRNSTAVTQLGEETVRAILAAEVYSIQAIAKLMPEATPALIAERELVLAGRNRSFALVAAAERQHSALVYEVRKDAIGVASKIAGALAGVGITVLKVAVTGG